MYKRQFIASCHAVNVDGVLGFPFIYQEFIKTINLIAGKDSTTGFTNYQIAKDLNILVVEDSLSYQNIYKECISKLGCNAVYCENGQQAWDRLKEGMEVDLIITDVIMPVMDGKEFSALVRSDYQYNNIPLIVASSIEQHETLKDFFKIGVNDYFTKPLDEDIFACRVKAHLRTRQLIKNEANLKEQLSSFNETLQIKVIEKTQALREANLEVIKTLVKVSEYKDEITGAHIQRVRTYSEVLARAIGISEDRIEPLGLGAMMHDVGKTGIPDSILKKPGKLTKEEREIMEQHPLLGEALFSETTFFKEAKLIAGAHHEKWDGSGYPRKLKGENIPIEARIVALADVFDALLSTRPYKSAFSLEKSIQILEEGSGKHFDPDLIKCFFSLIDQGVIGEIMAKFPYE